MRPHGGHHPVTSLRRRRYEVAHETRVAVRVVQRDDRRLGDGGLRDERRLDLTRLDAETVDLHLLIGAAVEHNRTVVSPFPKVPGAIEPLARSNSKRARNEARRGQSWPMQVATCQPGARDVQLTHDARRTGLQLRVEHENLSVRDGGADGLRSLR